MFDALCSSVRCWSCNTRQCCSLQLVVPKHQRSTATITYKWRHTHTHMQTNPLRAEEATLCFAYCTWFRLLVCGTLLSTFVNWRRAKARGAELSFCRRRPAEKPTRPAGDSRKPSASCFRQPVIWPLRLILWHFLWQTDRQTDELKVFWAFYSILENKKTKFGINKYTEL